MKIIDLNSSLTSLFFLSLGAIIGFFAWGWENTTSTTLSLTLLWLYLNINNRNQLFFILMGYYLATSRGLLVGTMNYYNLATAIAIWSLAAFISSSVWYIFWSKFKRERFYLLILVLFILIIPPIGLINWVNPLIVAGELFSGWRWFGFGFLLFFVYSADYIFSDKRALEKILFIISILFVGFYLCKTNKIQLSIIHPINTNFSKTETLTGFKKYELNNNLISLCNKSKTKINLMPENIIPFFNENDMMVWRSKISIEHSVLFGTYMEDKSNRAMYDNVLIKIDKYGWHTIYRQRVPVPISMWKPLKNVGAKAYLFSNPVIQINTVTKAGVFICYEQLIAITYFHTLLNNPDILLGSSNLWWAKSTSIKNIQLQTMKLWAKLFNIKYQFSCNE